MTGDGSIGFESDAAVPVVDPVFPDDDIAPDRQPSGDGTVDFVRALVHLRDPEAIGRRLLLLGWLYGVLPEVTSQRQLASVLGLSPGRTCELLQKLRSEFSAESAKRITERPAHW